MEPGPRHSDARPAPPLATRVGWIWSWLAGLLVGAGFDAAKLETRAEAVPSEHIAPSVGWPPRFPAALLLARDTADLFVHLPLAGDTRDFSGNGRHGSAHDVDLGAAGPGGSRHTAAAFDGRRSWIEIPGSDSPFGRNDFTISVFVQLEQRNDDVPGDIASKFDAQARRGVNFGILTLPGSTSSQPNYRNVHFGIDQAVIEPNWTDHGRLGEAISVRALAVHDGSLYAATCEGLPNETGRVFRMNPAGGWSDCGAPDRCNAVMALAVHDGELYAGTGKWRLVPTFGPSYPPAKNEAVGGNVYRYRGGKEWEFCGKISGHAEAVAGLVVFGHSLYASSQYQPGGLFRYDGGTRWAPFGTYNGQRPEALGVHNGRMYTTCYDAGAVFAFDGTSISSLGIAGDCTQTYGFVTHRGELLVTTWPKGKVYRHGGGQDWIDAGRLGDEMEIMGTVLYNGKVYAGTLPQARVFRYDDGTLWTDIGRLDHSTHTKYRRVWCLAVYQGRLFAGTTPEGRVFSIEAGRNATVDRQLPLGWHHLAAVRRGNRLEVFVDGIRAAVSAPFDPNSYDLTNAEPLRIGRGENDFFRGQLADFRLYRRALRAEEILARSRFHDDR